MLCKVFAREGIKHVASRAASARVEDGKIHLSTAAGDVLVVDKLFVAAGRVPRMKELNLRRRRCGALSQGHPGGQLAEDQRQPHLRGR